MTRLIFTHTVLCARLLLTDHCRCAMIWELLRLLPSERTANSGTQMWLSQAQVSHIYDSFVCHPFQDREVTPRLSHSGTGQISSPTHQTVRVNIYEPQHKKMCLREFPTRSDTNRPAQPQKLARVFKFRLQNLEILYYLSSEQQRR